MTAVTVSSPCGRRFALDAGASGRILGSLLPSVCLFGCNDRINQVPCTIWSKAPPLGARDGLVEGGRRNSRRGMGTGDHLLSDQLLVIGHLRLRASLMAGWLGCVWGRMSDAALGVYDTLPMS